MIFAIGDRVGFVNGKLKYYQDSEPDYGVITDLLSDGRVMVKWDSKWKNSHAQPLNPSKLMPESEIKAKYSELEKAFSKLEDDVRDKLKEASQLILDAQKIAKAGGFNLQELYEATGPLEHAMDEAGWQTSSWHC